MGSGQVDISRAVLGNFSCFCCCLLSCFQNELFIKFFQEHYQSVKEFGTRSGPTEKIRTYFLSVLIWFQTVCKGYQQMHAG